LLSVAGHLTIFQARTRGSFWSIRPARILLLAVLGTQALATGIAVFGIFMTPLGWRYAALVWGYALLWFVATDRVKLLGYRFLDPSAAVDDGTGSSRSRRSSSDLAAMASYVAPFHTDVDTSPGEPVYHDSSACPYAKEILRDGHERAGTGDRRRCEWCENQAVVTPFHTTIDTDEPVYHDLTACPHGQEVTRAGHDVTGAGDGRRCEWCEAHADARESREAQDKEKSR
jgi:H+-transporting ATPase